MRAAPEIPLGRKSGSRMWLVFALLAAVLLLAAGSPADAHSDHKKTSAGQVVPASPQPGVATVPGDPVGDHAAMAEMMERPRADRSKLTTFERLLDWFGRLHPMIVHFPIAFFPAALFTAIVGRRRPAFAKPVQFLIVAGGILAPIAAVLGWLDAGFDPGSDDGLLQMHRWLGTGIGVGALGLGLWFLRRPQEYCSRGTLIGLSAMTAAIVVQGWYGGAMIHGIDHMNW